MNSYESSQRLSLARCPFAHLAPIALVVAHLLEPEAGGGAVEDAEQRKMVILGRGLRQLDHWRGPIEDLSASIQHEMIMCSHERERY